MIMELSILMNTSAAALSTIVKWSFLTATQQHGSHSRGTLHHYVLRQKEAMEDHKDKLVNALM